jgi:hypothetical protein
MSTEVADPIGAEMEKLFQESEALDSRREALVIPMRIAADNCDLMRLAGFIQLGDEITTREIEVNKKYERLVQLRKQALGDPSRKS